MIVESPKNKIKIMENEIIDLSGGYSKEIEYDNKGNVEIEEYYLKGKRHREGGPAIEYKTGRKEWFIKGKRHRENGHALEYTNGYKEWYFNDKLHRKDGPAIEDPNGDKEWYINGQLHREDGPAVEWVDGHKAWYLRGKQLTEEEWLKKIGAKTVEVQSKEELERISKSEGSETNDIDYCVSTSTGKNPVKYVYLGENQMMSFTNINEKSDTNDNHKKI